MIGSRRLFTLLCIAGLVVGLAIPAAADFDNEQKLLAADGAPEDFFGRSVAIDGHTALVGAPDDDSIPGAAYVFTRTGGTWTEKAKLVASDGAEGDLFGYSVALDGNTALVGARGDDDSTGAAYVFTRKGNLWTQRAKLVASDAAEGDLFGNSVALEGNTALVGAFGDDDFGAFAGSAYVFTRSGTTWTEEAKLLAADGAESDRFGGAVSLDGNIALLGAPGNHDFGPATGSAYVFTRKGNFWTQQAELLASDGEDLDFMGEAVAVEHNIALVGAGGHDENGAESGSAYVFTRQGTIWTQQAELLASDGEEGDNFGVSMDLWKKTAIVGAAQLTSEGPGSAYVFTQSGSVWTQEVKLVASDGAPGEDFGRSVCLDDQTALVGARGDDDNGPDSGSAYVYES